MDVQSIGLVDYESFLDVLQLSETSRPKVRVNDGFDWEEGVIRKLKAWIRQSDLSAEEVFRTFDEVSYALVMNTQRPVHVEDFVRNP